MTEQQQAVAQLRTAIDDLITENARLVRRAVDLVHDRDDWKQIAEQNSDIIDDLRDLMDDVRGQADILACTVADGANL